MALTGCGTVARSSGPMQLGPDTFRISARAAMGSQTESQKMALTEARDHCLTLKRELMVTGTRRSLDAGPFEVTYRCLPAGDPDLTRPTLTKTPDTVVEVR